MHCDAGGAPWRARPDRRGGSWPRRRAAPRPPAGLRHGGSCCCRGAVPTSGMLGVGRRIPDRQRQAEGRGCGRNRAAAAGGRRGAAATGPPRRADWASLMTERAAWRRRIVACSAGAQVRRGGEGGFIASSSAHDVVGGARRRGELYIVRCGRYRCRSRCPARAVSYVITPSGNSLGEASGRRRSGHRADCGRVLGCERLTARRTLILPTAPRGGRSLNLRRAVPAHSLDLKGLCMAPPWRVSRSRYLVPGVSGAEQRNGSGMPTGGELAASSTGRSGLLADDGEDEGAAVESLGRCGRGLDRAGRAWRSAVQTWETDSSPSSERGGRVLCARHPGSLVRDRLTLHRLHPGEVVWPRTAPISGRVNVARGWSAGRAGGVASRPECGRRGGQAPRQRRKTSQAHAKTSPSVACARAGRQPGTAPRTAGAEHARPGSRTALHWWSSRSEHRGDPGRNTSRRHDGGADNRTVPRRSCFVIPATAVHLQGPG